MSSIFSKHIAPDKQHEYTIVFLHEGLGCTTMFGTYPDQLCERTGLPGFIYDRAGYGQSEGDLSQRQIDYLELAADDLHQVLKQFDLLNKKIILYGHSDGGSIALIYAAKYPEHIAGIITEAAHVFVEDITLKGIELAVSAFEQGKLNGLRKYHGNQFTTMFWAWANTWLNPEFKTWQIIDLLKKVTQPQLIIQGKQDQYGTLKQVDYIENETTGQSQVMIPDCGHAPFKVLPDAILKTSATFIKQITDAQSFNSNS